MDSVEATVGADYTLHAVLKDYGGMQGISGLKLGIAGEEVAHRHGQLVRDRQGAWEQQQKPVEQG